MHRRDTRAAQLSAYETLRAGGIRSKVELQRRLWELSNKEMAPRLRKLVKKQMGNTLASHVVGTALGLAARTSNLLTGNGLSAVPKFDRPESIHIIVAGGSAGKFSAFMPCFGFSR